MQIQRYGMGRTDGTVACISNACYASAKHMNMLPYYGRGYWEIMQPLIRWK